VDALPEPDNIPWDEVHDILVALITGTNGKTTTVRMLSAIAAAAGLTAGNTSADGVQLGGETILEGDYTGGEGARALLQVRRVDIAFLEVARGGMLRRGLPIENPDVAYVGNVGTDHLGEYSIDSLESLAEVKLLVAAAVAEKGHLVVNADDARLAPALAAPGTVAIRVDPDDAPDGACFARKRGRLGPLQERGVAPWLEQADVPATVGGAAVHNVYNALGAMAIATTLGIDRKSVVDGLSGFTSDARTNPGRCNVYSFAGLRAVIDYARNPEGLELVLRMVAAMRPERSLVVIGQAGDREDSAVDALADICASHAPDRVIVKTMHKYGRGRDAAEVARRIFARLQDAGMSAASLALVDDEMTAVREALLWGQAGDVLLRLSHTSRGGVIEFLDSLESVNWQPGTPLPPTPSEI